MENEKQQSLKQTKKCPKCGKEIQASAIKCRYCKSDLRVKAENHSSYWTFTILGLLIPIVGIILGIIYLAKNDELDRKLGEHIIAISVLGFILGFLLISMINFHV